MKVAYIRVSTTHQNTERQEYAMPKDIEKVYSEKISGKNTDRPQLKELIRKGDTVLVKASHSCRFELITEQLKELVF